MTDITIDNLCAHVGEEGLTRLVAAFYRQIPTDDVLGPLYPSHEMAAAEVRLRDFLIGRFGGSDRYIRERGHPRLRMRHAPFQVDSAARDRWVKLMTTALEEMNWSAEFSRPVQQFFEQTATFLINSPD